MTQIRKRLEQCGRVAIWLRLSSLLERSTGDNTSLVSCRCDPHRVIALLTKSDENSNPRTFSSIDKPRLRSVTDCQREMMHNLRRIETSLGLRLSDEWILRQPEPNR